MPERMALRLTSPANAWALGAMTISFLIPVLSVVEAYQPTAIEELSKPLADIWQWTLLLAASMALTAALLMQRAVGDGTRMRSVLRMEGIATTVVSASYGLLYAALVGAYGWGTAPLTQLLVGGLGLTAAGRVVQIVRDLVRYRRALAAGHLTHTEAIAQPKES